MHFIPWQYTLHRQPQMLRPVQPHLATISTTPLQISATTWYPNLFHAAPPHAIILHSVSDHNTPVGLPPCQPSTSTTLFQLPNHCRERLPFFASTRSNCSATALKPCRHVVLPSQPLLEVARRTASSLAASTSQLLLPSILSESEEM